MKKNQVQLPEVEVNSNIVIDSNKNQNQTPNPDEIIPKDNSNNGIIEINLEKSLTTSHSGDEEIIYEHDYPETNQVIVTRILLNYSSLIVILWTIEYFAVGITFIHIWNSKIPDFSPIFLLFFICTTLKITAEVYFSFVNHINSLVHLKSIIDSIANLLVYHAFYLYLVGFYSNSFFVLHLVLNICLQFIKMLIFYKSHQSFINYVFSIAESTTFLLIALKLSFPNFEFSWSLGLIMYTCLYYALIYSSSAFTFLFVLLTILYIFGAANLRDLEKSIIAMALGFWLFVLLFSSTFCLSYIGIRILLEKRMIFPDPQRKIEIPYEIFQAGVFMIVFGFIISTLVLIVNLFFKTYILRKASNSTGKQILLKRYFEKFNLKMKHISGNFFKKNSRNENENEGKKTDFVQTLDECVICQANQSAYLLSPCNHCVFCHECVRSYLELQSICPMCKTEIVRARKIRFSNETGQFQIDSAYKLRTL